MSRYPEVPIVVDGQRLPTMAQNQHGVTYAPVREMAQALGASVGWNGHEVTINTKNQGGQPMPTKDPNIKWGPDTQYPLSKDAIMKLGSSPWDFVARYLTHAQPHYQLTASEESGIHGEGGRILSIWMGRDWANAAIMPHTMTRASGLNDGRDAVDSAIKRGQPTGTGIALDMESWVAKFVDYCDGFAEGLKEGSFLRVLYANDSDFGSIKQAYGSWGSIPYEHYWLADWTVLSANGPAYGRTIPKPYDVWQYTDKLSTLGLTGLDGNAMRAEVFDKLTW